MNIYSIRISRLHFVQFEITNSQKIGANLSNFGLIHNSSGILHKWKRFCKFVDYFAYGKREVKNKDNRAQKHAG